VAYYVMRNKGKSFINSEGELVNSSKDEMIDEKLFDETVVHNETPTQDGFDDDTFVHGSRPNNAVNF
jgi:hypothetical protein